MLGRILILALFITIRGMAFDRLRVKTPDKSGWIYGKMVKMPFDGTVYESRQFLGIPYAEPPLGDKRFRKPTMLKNLPSSHFRAYAHGPICPQVPFGDNVPIMSEDCLYLNINTPMPSMNSRKPKPQPLPVMVYFHGGAFVFDWSNIYDGSILSAINNVIFVSFNYRLGPVGFFSTHDINAPGNYGLWDQQLALQWVKYNIASFGGDPDSITILGHSAGASSVVYQSLYSGNRGIIKRAIAQSGTVAGWGVNRFNSSLTGSIAFAHALGCNLTSTTDIVSCLRGKESHEIMDASNAVQTPTFPFDDVNNSWTPVFDDDFVTEEPLDLLKLITDENIANFEPFPDIELMIGANNFDGHVYFSSSLFRMNVAADSSGEYPVTMSQINDTIVPRVAQNVLGELPSPSVIDAIAFEYSPWTDPSNKTLLQKSLIDLYTDSFLYAPSIRTARAHELGNRSTYVYRFSVSPPKNLAQFPPSLQGERVASHLDDLGFLLGFPGSFGLSERLGYTIDDITPEMLKVSKAMMRMWTNFAQSGSPNNPLSLEDAYPGLWWPEFEAGREQYLKIEPRMSANSIDMRLAARAAQFWNNFVPKLQDRTRENINV